MHQHRSPPGFFLCVLAQDAGAGHVGHVNSIALTLQQQASWP